MKKSWIDTGILMLVFAATVLVSCKKETPPQDLTADTPSFTQQESGKFKKTLTIADAGGQNAVEIEFSTDFEPVFNAFDESVFSLETVEDLRPGVDAVGFEGPATEAAGAPADAPKAEGGQPYFVQILGKKMAPGVRALQLNIDLDRLKASADEAADRANTYLGIFTNGGPGVGITNAAQTCTNFVLASYQYKSNGNWLNWSYNNTSSWAYFSTKTACTGGQNNNNSTLLTKSPCQLRNYVGKNWPFPLVTGVFSGTSGNHTRMLVWTNSPQVTNLGNTFGIFIFG